MEIKVEGLYEPIGLDEAMPRFSYIIQAKEGSTKQSAYQIIVKNNDQTAWDSGKKNSDQTVYIPYDGQRLQPYTTYTVNIQSTDNLGNTYEGNTFFETGKLDTTMKGKYIGAPFSTAVNLEQEDVSPWLRPVVFRKKLQYSGKTAKARLYVSSMGTNVCQINGHMVGDCYLAPGWTTHQKRMQYYAFDIAGLLKEGENSIDITVSNGWYNRKVPWADIGQQKKFSNNLAAIAYIRLEEENNLFTEIETDESWLCGYGNILLSGIFEGEVYDATIAPAIDQSVVLEEYDKNLLVGLDCEPVKVVERLPIAAILNTPKGETVLDVGENIAGFPVLKITGIAGERVILEFGEELDQQGNFYNANYRAASCRYEYILKDGYQEYTPTTTFYKFRYVKVTEFPGQPEKNHFEFAVLCNDMQPTGSFSCSHEDINQLHRNICRSMKGNYIDIPTDCPQRDERLGWTADAQEFLSTACYLYNVNPFFKKWLADLALEQGPKGAVPVIVPNINLNAGVEGNDFSTSNDTYDLAKDTVNWANFWSDAATICPYTLYTYYHDTRLLQNQLLSMDKWCDFLYTQFLSPEGISTKGQYGDWVALDAQDGAYIGATPLDYIACACMLHSMKLTVQAANVLEDKQMKDKWQRRHESALALFNQRFCTSEGVVTSSTQTAKIIALKYKLVPNKALQAKQLAEQIQVDGCRLVVGFIGIPYILEVLSENGYANLAYQLLLRTEYPSWLYQVKKGATSIWEHLDGIKEDGSFWSAGMNSFNHYAYGSVGEWIYSRIGGIQLDNEYPGFKHFVITPLVHPSVTNATSSYQSIYGKITCCWNYSDGKFDIKVTVPFNTSANIVLPSGKTEKVCSGEHHFVEDLYL